MARLPVELRHRHGLASRGRHAEQRTARVWRKQNDAVRVPGPAAGGRAVANVCGAPPPRSSRFSLPSAKKPTERLSGDQKG